MRVIGSQHEQNRITKVLEEMDLDHRVRIEHEGYGELFIHTDKIPYGAALYLESELANRGLQIVTPPVKPKK